jgi:hypothetical protein
VCDELTVKVALLAMLALLGTLAIGGSASALPAIPAHAAAPSETVILGGGAIFDVQSFSQGDLSVTGVSLSTDRATQVAVSVPRGYSLDLTRPVGTTVGFVTAFLQNVKGDASSFADSDLIVDDPANDAGDTAAQACASGPHAAVLRASFTVLGGQRLSLPLFIDPVIAGGGFVIRFCPQWPPSGSLVDGVSAVSVSIVIGGLRAPDASGTYMWSALVTPATEASFQSLPSKSFEMRVLVPLPHKLTLHAKYDAKKKTALLSGQLTAVGQPEAGASVSFFSFTGTDQGSDDFGPVTTDASGRFSLQRHVTRTTSFTAAVGQSEPRTCSSSSSAPGGCFEMVARPESASANVVLRGPREPRLQRRTADQARARRAALKLNDLPEGWESYTPDPFEPNCPHFKPDLSDLTTTGEVSSPDFVSEDAAAYSDVSVYLTVAEAQKAFAREAQVGEANCYADLLREAKVAVLGVSRVSFPRLGDQAKAFRLVFSYEAETYVVDFVSLRRGRLVTRFGFYAEGVPLALERDLVAKVAARAGGG